MPSKIRCSYTSSEWMRIFVPATTLAQLLHIVRAAAPRRWDYAANSAGSSACAGVTVAELHPSRSGNPGTEDRSAPGCAIDLDIGDIAVVGGLEDNHFILRPQYRSQRSIDRIGPARCYRDLGLRVDRRSIKPGDLCRPALRARRASPFTCTYWLCPSRMAWATSATSSSLIG